MLFGTFIHILTSLIRDFCTSDRNFASTFFQIPPHDGHPWSWLVVGHCDYNPHNRLSLSRSNGLSYFFLLMFSLLIAFWTIFFNSHTFRMFFLISCTNIIFFTANRALKCNTISHVQSSSH